VFSKKNELELNVILCLLGALLILEIWLFQVVPEVILLLLQQNNTAMVCETKSIQCTIEVPSAFPFNSAMLVQPLSTYRNDCVEILSIVVPYTIGELWQCMPVVVVALLFGTNVLTFTRETLNCGLTIKFLVSI